MDLLKEIKQKLKENFSGTLNLTITEEDDLVKLPEYELAGSTLIVIDKNNVKNNCVEVEFINLNGYLGSVLENLEDFLKEEGVWVAPLSDILPQMNSDLKEYEDFIKERIAAKCNNYSFYGYKAKVSAKEITKEKDYRLKIKIYAEKNIPLVEILDDDGLFKNGMRVPTRAKINLKNSKTWFRFSLLDDILKLNNISEKDVLVSRDSIDSLYYFVCGGKEEFFVKPTKSVVSKWWNYDLPTLYKYTTNKTHESNGFGLTFLCWSETLVDSTLGTYYISEDIKEDEINSFALNYGVSTDHPLVKAMYLQLNKSSVSDNHKQEVLSNVKDLENKLNEYLLKHTEDILKDAVHVVTNYGYFTDFVDEIKFSSKKDMYTYILNKSQPNCLDCGFMYIKPAEQKLKDLFLEAAAYDSKRFDCTLNLTSVWFNQSTTIQKIVGDTICSHIKKDLGIDLYCTTILD